MKSLFILLQRILPQHLLSRCAGFLAGIRTPWFKNMAIRQFVRIFHVNMSEAESARAEDYLDFNAFFTRRLKPNARPVSGSICAPADGVISALGSLAGGRLLQAKGITYSLEKLLAGANAPEFVNGSFLTVYLAPADYHRVHMPISAELMSCRYVPGKLFSVNETTTTRVTDLFATNERLICSFQREAGPMIMIMVGAMIVAGIQPVWRENPWAPRQPNTEEFNPPRPFQQGEEFARFRMGSTVILLFPENVDWRPCPKQRIRLGESLVDGT
ncbi:MAG: archaetidylserine decarboxylase [Pseudomonadales bacterium]